MGCQSSKVYNQRNVTVTFKNFDGVPVSVFQSNNSIFSSFAYKPIIVYFRGESYLQQQSSKYYENLCKILAGLSRTTVISINYTCNQPYPMGLDDCWRAIRYIHSNAEALNVDLENMIFMGDSHGGAIVTVMVKRCIENKMKLPILQTLIYPRLNLVDFTLPSHLCNKKDDWTKVGDIYSNLVSSGLNKKKINKEMVEEIRLSKHLLLIDDINVRLKYLKYIDYNLIPTQYKNGYGDYKTYVKDHAELVRKLSLPDADLDDKCLLKCDEEFSKSAFKLLLPEMSPSFLSDSLLKKFPQTYLIVVENDPVKDENFIFSERLKRNGVKVNVAYYLNKSKGRINENGYDFEKNNEKYMEDMIEYILNLFLKLYDNL